MNQANAMLLALSALVLKHYFADFMFQNGYMLMGKGKPGLKFVAPLAVHCLEHAGATALILLVYSPSHVWVALIDFIVHFGVDRAKALYKIDGGVWKPENKVKNLNKFYAAFGADQTAHYLTYIVLLYIVANF